MTTSKYWSPIVAALHPYVPGEQPKLTNLIKLNTNENPYGPSPRALEAMRAQIDNSLRLYPDPNAETLKQSLAQYYGLQTSQVFVGNGSDEVLALVFMGLLKHTHPILFPDITYSFYPVYCSLYEIDYRAVPLDEDFRLSIADYSSSSSTKIGGIIFPNPNAPTGCALTLSEIEQIITSNPDCVVVIDEAYVDFGAQSAVSLIASHPNLLVIQTFSKSRALAGLRVGFALGNADLITALERIKNSFNSYPLDRIAIAGACAALEDQAWFERSRQSIIDTRTRLVGELTRLGFNTLPSAANFVFTTHPKLDARTLAAQLRERNIIARHFSQPRIEQFLRITVGADKECEALVQALEQILAHQRRS